MKHIASIFIALSLCTLPCFNVIAEDFAALDAIFQADNEHNEDKSKSTIEEICKTKSYQLNCTNLTIRCNNGFVSGMTNDKAVAILCADETTEKEVERRRNLQKTAAERFCKSASNMTFNNNCKSNNSVEFGCTEYKHRVESEIKKAMQNYCNADTTNTVFIKDEKTKKFTQKANLENELLEHYCNETDNKNGANMNGANISCVGNKITITCSYSIKTKEPASHKAKVKYDFSPICKNGNDSKEYSITVKLNEKMSANAKLEDICKEGDKGDWDDKKDKCTCKNSEHIFDEKQGCITETKASTTAKTELETLKNKLTEALEKIAQANNG